MSADESLQSEPPEASAGHEQRKREQRARETLARENQRKTYLYLRLGMLGVILLVAISVAIEIVEMDGCVETSISAYYYTPARAVFVSALITIGACLVIIRGYIDVEDIALNLAGMLAPIVAFVPTSSGGDCRLEALRRTDPEAVLTFENARPAIDNNVSALIIIGWIAFVLAVVLVALAPKKGTADLDLHPRTARDTFHAQLAGLVLAFLILLTMTLWFTTDPQGFKEDAHNPSAIILFVFIAIVVHVNAIKDRDRSLGDLSAWFSAFKNRFGLVTALMGIAVISAGVAAWGYDYDHTVFGIEAAMIGLFAWFWTIQTVDAFRRRPPATSPVPRRPPGAPPVTPEEALY
jgi:hypothetical protein